MKKNLLVEDLIRPSIESLGYELVGVEFHANTVNSLLRVFIDKSDGIGLEDCVAVNEQITAILDVEDPIPNKYTLEISSPGIDRPLFSISDFKKFIGQQVKLRLGRPIKIENVDGTTGSGQRNFKGIIVSVENDIISLEFDDKHVSFSFDDVDNAKLIPIFD